MSRRALELLHRFLTVLSTGFLRVAMLLYLVSLIVMVGETVQRNLLSRSWPWAIEAITFSMGLSVLLSLSHAALERRHLTVEFFTAMLPPRVIRSVELVALALSAVTCGVLVAGGRAMVANSLRIGLLSQSNLGIPMWIPQSFVPLGFALLGLAFLSQFIYLIASSSAEGKERL